MGKSKLIEKKELGCGGKCCKMMLYMFNALFLISGLTLLVLGLWVAVSSPSNQIASIVETNLYKAAAYLLFISGTCVLFVGFIGCCGAKYENRCLLGSYFLFLLIIFLFEFVAGIIALACYTQAESVIEGNLNDTLLSYGSTEPGNGNITEGWDYVQMEFKCCGVIGTAKDAVKLYEKSRWYIDASPPKKAVPLSCCVRNKNEIVNENKCQNPGTDYSGIYQKGCYTSVRDKVIQYATVLAGVGIAVSVIQIFGMIYSFCVFRHLT